MELKMKQPKGIWRLIDPKGQEFAGPSPIKCMQSEVNSRVPKEIQAQRFVDFMNTCCFCEKKIDGEKYRIRFGQICMECARTVFEDLAKVFM